VARRVSAGAVGLGDDPDALSAELEGGDIARYSPSPIFLKVPMVAMSLLPDCPSPRPSRSRWRSRGHRRSATHPQGRSAAEDGGGKTFLFREEWASLRAQGKKV
jgi:hypothetical protein